MGQGLSRGEFQSRVDTAGLVRKDNLGDVMQGLPALSSLDATLQARGFAAQGTRPAQLASLQSAEVCGCAPSDAISVTGTIAALPVNQYATVAAENALMASKVSSAALQAYPRLGDLKGLEGLTQAEMTTALDGLASDCSMLQPPHQPYRSSEDVLADRYRVRCAALAEGLLCSEAPSAVLSAPLIGGLMCWEFPMSVQSFGTVPVYACADTDLKIQAVRSAAERHPRGPTFGFAHGRQPPPADDLISGHVYSGCYRDDLCPLGDWEACARKECELLGGAANVGHPFVCGLDYAKALRCTAGATR